MIIRCRIADLIVEVPEAGGLAPRLQEYIYAGDGAVDIVINPDQYNPTIYSAELSENSLAYLESGRQFLVRLMDFGGFYLHSSSVVYEGRGYLFSADSGTGKSTHTKIWQQVFGERAQIFNDDKPALRCIDGKWYAYGTPWCGKDGINLNAKVPLAGICFLKQGRENSIRRLSPPEAFAMCMAQTQRFYKTENAEKHMLLQKTSHLSSKGK